MSDRSGAAGRARWPVRPAGIAYGGDYNPEQWPEATWLDDVRLMREAGVGLVAVGVFAWSRLQPRPQAWDFGWLDRVLDLLASNGIAVDLATATATPPPWFSLRHPESLPVTASGTRLGIGSRQHVCPSSPPFRAASAELVERLAVRYGRHPAVVMWHIGNEYGDHVTECFCDVSAADFREWLGRRHGTLDALNDAWTTDVWSGRIGDWAEVMPPRAAPGPVNPSLVLDWRRFSSDALLACHEAERAILARITPELPVTTNFMRLNDGIEHRRFAAAEDLVSIDLYPDPADPGAPIEAALSEDMARSLGGGRPWLLMEQARSAVDWRPVNAPRPPALLRLDTLAAVGRGADGIGFFQWRGSRGGPEAFHSAMLPAGGTETRGWATTVSLGRELRLLGEVAGSVVRAETALLVDWESWWALDVGSRPSDRLRCREQALAWHGALHASNVAVDVRGPEEDLAAYRLVVAPNVFALSEAAVANLTSFVSAGGVLVIGPFSGVADPDRRLPAGPHPALLRDLLGLTWEQVWPLAAGDDVGVRFAGGETARAAVWREEIDLVGAEATAEYEDGDLAGWPAVTRRRLGSGEVRYVGTVLDAAGTAFVIDDARRAAGVDPVAEVPAGVEAMRRDGRHATYLFLLDRSGDGADVPVPDGGTDLLSGVDVPPGGSIRLGPRGAAVVRTAPPA